MASKESSPSSPSLSSANVLSYLTILLNLIDAKDWVTFNEMTTQNPTIFRALSDILSTANEFHGMTFLHALARNHPPLEIVANVIRICPSLPRAQDCLNRTPLHIAAGTGADVRVIEYLAMTYPEACKIQDEDGKTPLHFACDVDCQLFEEEQERRSPPAYEVVHTLLCASITPAAMEDEDEMSPLEYAIFSNADVRVVKLLQKTTQRFMKNAHARKKQDDYTRRMSKNLGAAA